MSSDRTPHQVKRTSDEANSDCIFCQIVAGDMSARQVYEDEDFLAFLDIRPLNPGHTIVIPKQHYRWVWDIPQIGDYFRVCRKIANAQRQVLRTDWVVSLVVGEEVDHAHVWLVPRFEDDGHGGAIDLEAVKDIEEEELESMREKLAKALEE